MRNSQSFLPLESLADMITGIVDKSDPSGFKGLGYRVSCGKYPLQVINQEGHP